MAQHYEKNIAVKPKWFNLSSYEESESLTNYYWADLLRARGLIKYLISHDELEHAKSILSELEKNPLIVPDAAYSGEPVPFIEDYDIFKLMRDLDNLWKISEFKEIFDLMRDRAINDANNKFETWKLYSKKLGSKSLVELSKSARDIQRSVLSINLNAPDDVLKSNFDDYLLKARKEQHPTKQTKSKKSKHIKNRWLPLLDLYFHKKLANTKLNNEDIYNFAYEGILDEPQAVAKGEKELIKANKFIGNPTLIEALGCLTD